MGVSGSVGGPVGPVRAVPLLLNNPSIPNSRISGVDGGGSTGRNSVEGSDALFCTVDDGTGEQGGRRIRRSRGCGNNRALRVSCAAPQENVGSRLGEDYRVADGGFRCLRRLRAGVDPPTVLRGLVGQGLR